MTSQLATKMKHDGTVTIAVGRSRKEKNWKHQEMLWSELVARLSRTHRTHETYAEYLKMPKAEQDRLKDVGGFVGGTLRGGRRKADAVAWRQIICLDADYVKEDMWASVEIFLDCACVMYSTHKHSPQKPRLRLVIVLKRPVTSDEYQAIARRIAADLGIDCFDDTTYQPHRLMYWPSTSKDGKYMFKYQGLPWLDPDQVLARYPDWRDQSHWPESLRSHQIRKKQAERQGDPLEKPGLIGAFCRTYSISEALETFLADVYQPCEIEGRYSYIAGTTTAGLVLYDGDKFAYSHHGTDPISGKLVNAFDLVRLHKFGNLDENAAEETPATKLPSFKAMMNLAGEDKLVKHTIKQERLAAIEEDFRGEEVDPKRLFFWEKDFIPAYMGEWFLRRHKSFVMNEDLYIYADGVYVNGERVFLEESTAALGVEFRTIRIKEAIAYIKNSVVNVSPQEAVTNNNFLNVQNGLINLDTFELSPHTPDLRTIVQLPVMYDPDADETYINKFLQMVLPEDCIPVVEELAGCCLIPTMKYETAAILLGEGGNGKGTLIALLTQMLGERNVAGVSFQDLSENRFAAAGLFGKMANLHADIPAKVIENSARFKELVSGDMIRAEEKHKQAFYFRSRAKLIFSANEPPVSKDNTDGFHRKLIIIPFPNKFNDRELREKLFEPQNMSGFLLRALKGLKRLQTKGGFSKSKNVEKCKAEYRRKGDTVFRFIEECCTFEPEVMTPKQEVYDSYRAMCLRWGNQAINQANFNSRLQVLRPDVKEYRKGTPRRWKGLKLENDSDFL